MKNTLTSSKSILLAATVSLLVMMAAPLSATEYNANSLSLSIDNDGLLGTDKDYTNGLFLKFNAKREKNITQESPLAMRTLGSWLPLAKESNKGWGITVGQKIWTPTDITSSIEEENSRPYTGLLFMNLNISEYSPSFANKYNLMLGTVGPDAFGEKAQSSVHSLIGSKQPQGWQRQINNQTIFNIGYEGQRLLSRSKDNTADIGISSRVNVGNYQSELAIGSTLRWGSALSESFASVGSIPGNYIDPSALSNSRVGQFYYVAIESRYRFQDITIDGARPKHLFDVHTRHLQASISTGAVYYQEKWGAALSIISSSPDYKEDTQAYNSTASLEIFWRC